MTLSAPTLSLVVVLLCSWFCSLGWQFQPCVLSFSPPIQGSHHSLLWSCLPSRSLMPLFSVSGFLWVLFWSEQHASPAAIG
ncbi:hypothetical protein BDF14DRAFT_1799972, partial [Spinellus fusiger]